MIDMAEKFPVTADRELIWPLAAALAVLLLAPLRFGAAGEAIDSGSLLREFNIIPPAGIPSPADKDGSLPVIIQPEAGASQASGKAGTSFILKDVKFIGNELLGSEILRETISPSLDSSIDLNGLNELALKLSARYREAGYPLARVVVEPQKVVAGIVTMRALETRYQNVTVENSSRLRRGRAEAVLAGSRRPGGKVDGLRSGDHVELVPLRKRMRLLSETPGVKATSAFQAPADKTLPPDRTDLLVKLVNDRWLRAQVESNNHGNEATGRYRSGGRFWLDNSTGLGDQVFLHFLVSDKNFLWMRGSWDVGIGSEGTRLGVGASRMDYSLSGPGYQDLDASGTADTIGLWLDQPLLIDSNRRTTLRLHYDRKWMEDEYGALGITNDKHADVAGLTLSGWIADERGFGSVKGGVTIWSAAITAGNLYLPPGDQRLQDDAGPRSRGAFMHISGSIARDQRLWGGGDSPLGGILHLSASGLWSPGGLDSSEKFSLGGPFSVRGYPAGEISGDAGTVLTAEYRQTFPKGFSALVGLDAGFVKQAAHAWFSSDEMSNYRTLSSVTIGIGWNKQNRVNLDVSASWRLTREAQGGRNLEPRLWFSGSVRF
jgi:hemolysin activation/secretion protein